MEDTIDTGTLPPVLVGSVQPFPLIALPIEVRNKILGHLLPNSLEVKPLNQSKCSPNVPYYRPNDEACHTAILRANYQLQTEGTAVMYNRAFRVYVSRRGFEFLNLEHYLVDGPRPKFREFEPSMRYIRTNEPKPERPFDFPFYRVKQVQIEIWAHDFRYSLFDIRNALFSICSILYRQPILKNVRIDFFDLCYRPSRCNVHWSDWPYISYGCWSFESSLFDDDEAHPTQDRRDAKVRKRPARFDPDDHLWERQSGVIANSDDMPCKITKLEMIVQPLKLLRNVGKARINLTPGMEKDEDMRRLARECQDAMMSSSPQKESDLDYMDRCTDPSNPWALEKLSSNDHP